MAEWYARQSKANLSAHIVKQDADLAAARAENDRLTKSHDTVCGALAEAIKRAEKAKSALEAYGREKVREGMKRAAEVCGIVGAGASWIDCRDAILADMENLK